MIPEIRSNILLGSPRSLHSRKLYRLDTSIEALDLNHRHSGVNRLSGDTCWIELASVERERTPDQTIEIGIQLHLIHLSVLNIRQYLETLGVKWSQAAIYS